VTHYDVSRADCARAADSVRQTIAKRSLPANAS
jgi:hypothetical protein